MIDVEAAAGSTKIALPHRLSGRLVRRAHRDHIVEPAGPQKGRIQRVHRVGGTHQKPAVVLAECRDQLEQFVGHAQLGSRRTGPGGGDLLDLVDEQHQLVEFGHLGERLPQRGSQAAGAGGRQSGGEQLDERPSQPGRNRLGEAGFARTGWAEQNHRLGWADPVPFSDLRVRQGVDDAAFDDLFLVFHPGQVVPQPGRQDQTAEFVE